MNDLTIKNTQNNMTMSMNTRKLYIITFKASTTTGGKPKILIYNSGFDHLNDKEKFVLLTNLLLNCDYYLVNSINLEK